MFINNFIYFFLNGDEYCISSKITLLDLIQYFSYDESLIILEYNNLICNQKSWSNIKIKPKDKIEILTIVGGG